ncbi:hypothetical protein MN608_04466 [Microdochium nivale]|nr:hypothetical protein MN608_04466 [Microdochium nivale]
MEDPSAKGLAVKPWEDKFEDSPSTARHGWLIWGKGGKSISTTKSGFGKRTIQLGNEEGHEAIRNSGQEVRQYGKEGRLPPIVGSQIPESTISITKTFRLYHPTT